MACINQTPQTTTPTTNRGFIYDTLAKIDQMQKAATVQSACEGCEGSLISAFYNTKPITCYLCCGNTYTVTLPEVGSTETTNVFRIENIKNDCVVLRLITVTDSAYTCTNYTTILKIDCICGLQCHAPICCEACTGTCGNN